MSISLNLTRKVLLLSLLVGIATWTILDVLQGRYIRDLFRAQMMEQLETRSKESRFLFDEYVRSHHQAARFYATQANMDGFFRHIRDQGWPEESEPLHHRTPPPWYPRNSVLRVFAHPRHVLLLDQNRRVREIYGDGPDAPPSALLENDLLFSKLSHSDGLLTEIGGMPYLLSSAPILKPDDSAIGWVVLASPLDSELLHASQRQQMKKGITVLAGHGRVLATNQPDVVPLGTTIDSLKGEYVTTGKSFFDFGVSDLSMEFLSLISTREVKALSDTILRQERLQRLLTALTLIIVFSLLSLAVARRVRQVTRGIAHFSEKWLGYSPDAGEDRDELTALEARFRAFTAEILQSREALTRMVEEKTRSDLESEQSGRVATLLQSVTEVLEVGVLRDENGRLEPMNQIMRDHLRRVGSSKLFFLDRGDREQRRLDADGVQRVFDIRRPPEGFLLVRDITDEHETQQRLRLAMEVIDNATDGMFVASDNFQMRLVNPAFITLTGCCEGPACSGISALDLLFPDKARHAQAQKLLRMGQGWEGEVVLAHAESNPRTLRLRIDPVADDRDRITNYVGVVSDVTERARAREQLHGYAEELKKSNEEVRSFAYIVSHDLRTPLINIKGFVGELRYSMDEVTDAVTRAMSSLPTDIQAPVENTFSREIPEALDFIDSAVQRMDKQIQSVLKLSRAGRRELRLEPIDVGAVAYEQLENLAYQLDEQNIEVRVGTLPAVVADRTALEHIFANLLSNAIRYLDPGRPGRISVDGETLADETVYHVRDNGRGIGPADYDKVFEPLRRGASSEGVAGEGIGLTYLRTMVRRHGGRVWFDSEPGVGTVFSFSIPQQHPEVGHVPGTT